MGQSALGFIAASFQGSIAPGRVDPQSALFQSQRHGKYYASVYGTPARISPSIPAQAGSVFRGSNPTAVAISAALATTYTGLCLSNPAGSTVNLAVKRAAGVLFAAQTAFIVLGLITGWSAAGVVTHTTSLNADIINGYVGAAAASGSVIGPTTQAKLDSAATIVGTPMWDRWITGNTVTAVPCNFSIDLDDDLIIPPGGYVAIGANAASTATSFLGSFMWEEIAP